MADVHRHNKQTHLRMFESDFFEWFSHVHPITPLLVWGPVALFLIYRGLFVHALEWEIFTGLGVTAVLLWTLMEYWMHRSVFHYEPKGKWGKRIVFMFHGIHHDDPQCATRLVMPPAVSLGIAAVVFPLCVWGWGREMGEVFFAFFVVGYLSYDYIHYAVHHFRPRTAVGRFLKYHHMQHHFVTPDLRIGVSNPLWDFVFGTYPKARPQMKTRRIPVGIRRASEKRSIQENRSA